MKRIVCFLMAILILAMMIPVTASADAINTDLLLDMNISQINAVGYQTPYTTSCACFALAYCRTILDNQVHNWWEYNANGDFNENGACTGWSTGGGQYSGVFPGDENVTLNIMYNELSAGRPVVVRVIGNGNTVRTTGFQHYVAIVGYTNVDSLDDITINNFLMIDSVGAVDANGNHTVENVGDHYNLFFTDNCYQIVQDTSGKSVTYRATPKYISQCVYYPSYGTIEIIRDNANIMDRPCSTATDPDSTLIESGGLDAKYIVTGLYENTAGNYWYRLITKSGKNGYIYSGNCQFISGLFLDVEFKESNIPTELMQGVAYNLGGTVSSPYSQMSNVSFWVYDSAGEKRTGNAVDVSGSSYKLSEPAIDYNVVFNNLPAGNYECVVTATVTAYFYNNAKGKIGVKHDLELYRGNLTIKDPAQVYYTLTFDANGGTVAPTTMSVLNGSNPGKLPIPVWGDEYFAGWFTAAVGGTQVTTETTINTSQTVYAHWGCTHQYTMTETTPSCTEFGEKLYRCSICGDSYSESIAALGHSYDFHAREIGFDFLYPVSSCLFVRAGCSEQIHFALIIIIFKSRFKVTFHRLQHFALCFSHTARLFVGLQKPYIEL